MAGRPARPVVPLTVRQRFLVAKNRGLVYYLVRRFLARVPGAAYLEDDLIGEGMLGLIAAAQSPTYDPRRVRFTTYASRAILNRVSRAVGETLIHVPVWVREGQKVPKRPTHVPTVVPFGEDAESGGGEVLVPGRDDPPDAALLQREDEEARRHTAKRVRWALQRLTLRERQVMRARYGLGQPAALTRREVGCKLRISVTRVREIEAAARGKLRTVLRAPPALPPPVARR